MTIQELAKMPARGIIFSSPMVRAILEDRKTMSRRLDRTWLKVKKGDLLWVRETLLRGHQKELGSAEPCLTGHTIIYAADSKPVPWAEGAEIGYCDFALWQWPQNKKGVIPGRFMPRWATRAYLEATADARLERLQEITEGDAIKEGSQIPIAYLSKNCQQAAWTERQQFARIWDSLNGKRVPWESNPEAVVLQSRRINGQE